MSLLDQCMPLLKYDPMYTYDDVEMIDGAEEEAWDYGDEEQVVEDTSAVVDSTWKVRRGAARVILAIVETRSELLPEII